MKTTVSRTMRVLLCLCVALNVLDIALHVSTGQAELLRIASNVIIIVASGLVLSRRRQNSILAIGLILYLTLNGIFILLNGIGGAGIVFISLTTIFVGLYEIRTNYAS